MSRRNGLGLCQRGRGHADGDRKNTAAEPGGAVRFEDPEWLKYIEMNAEAGYLIKQESKLMSPAPFAPIKR